MNEKKLKIAEKEFLKRYPKGFADEALGDISKKHPIDSITTLIKDALQKTPAPKDFAPQMVKVVSRSSMVSMFEKPKFRDWVKGLFPNDLTQFTDAIKELLTGSQEMGFTMLLELLEGGKLARWSLISLFAFYHNPKKEVFIKPNTTKDVISHFELEGLEYKPKPDYGFYKKYRSAITKMKKVVHPSLSPNSAAFTGFLMMTMMNRER